MVDIDPLRDYYAILGVAVDATQDDIRHAYRRLAKSSHPDSGSGDLELLRRAREAHAVLGNDVTRDAYDQMRAARGIGTAPLVIDATQSRTDLPLVEGEQMLYVTLDLVPRPDLLESRRDLNLALVIDRSTSMRSARIENVKAAALDLVNSLTPDDRLAVIVFSDRAEVVVPSTPVSDRGRIRSAILSIVPEGGTEIYQGLAAGIAQVRPHTRKDAISHVLLLTDGRTYGDEGLALAAAARVQADGIGISAFGIGEDWHDTFLDDLARQGGGSSHYIDAPSKVKTALQAQVKQLGALLVLRARARIRTAPGVRLTGAYRASPTMEFLSNTSDRDSLVLPLGSLTADAGMVLALEFAVALSDAGTHRVARVTIEGDSMGADKPVSLWHDIWVTLSEDVREAEVPPRLLNILGRLSIFRLQEQAWRALEVGMMEQATQALHAAATRLFDLGYQELGQAAMLEVGRISQGADPSDRGRKQLRYGTRALNVAPSSLVDSGTLKAWR
ncbi:MAG: VWA domain-containing protein [Anaerolineae bacterium]|jgi:Ca-activated chloride channel family protein|nr:VWA domain-containing protein [Anaerolineae bacterium]